MLVAPDELAALLVAPGEHPTRNIPPPSKALPTMRPTMAPYLVRPVRMRRVKLDVFSMPV
jgi:hypothetical protein